MCCRPRIKDLSVTSSYLHLVICCVKCHLLKHCDVSQTNSNVRQLEIALFFAGSLYSSVVLEYSIAEFIYCGWRIHFSDILGETPAR